MGMTGGTGCVGVTGGTGCVVIMTADRPSDDRLHGSNGLPTGCVGMTGGTGSMGMTSRGETPENFCPFRRPGADSGRKGQCFIL